MEWDGTGRKKEPTLYYTQQVKMMSQYLEITDAQYIPVYSIDLIDWGFLSNITPLSLSASFGLVKHVGPSRKIQGVPRTPARASHGTGD